MVKIAVNGACGRMGKMLIEAISVDEECALSCALESSSHQDVGKDAGVAAGIGSVGVDITFELQATPDVLIDFTTPQASVKRAAECVESTVAVVMGTTGHSQQQKATLRDMAGSIPLLMAPNMSLGVNLLFGLAGRVARALGEDYDIEVVETHHRMKKDAPSGTALELAKRVCSALQWDIEDTLCFGREGAVGKRPRRQIGVHAVRGGDITGTHTVIFAGSGECIELRHVASGRDIFARGALRAAKFVAAQPPGLYSIEDVIGTSPQRGAG